VLGQVAAQRLQCPLFFFNRLKAKEEGRGDGTVLMQELLIILDAGQITVVNPINAYGLRTTNELIRFFSKFDFRHIGLSVLLREPKINRLCRYGE